MEATRIDIFMATMADKVSPQQALLMRERLEKADDSSFGLIQSLPYKSPIFLLVISLFFGGLAVDRFLLGETGLAVLKLITCGGLGIWTLIDWFLIMGRTRDYNFELFMKNVR